MFIVNHTASVNPHPINRARLTQTTDELLDGLIALRRERTVPAWKLRAAGIAPLADLEHERPRRARRIEVAS